MIQYILYIFGCAIKFWLHFTNCTFDLYNLKKIIIITHQYYEYNESGELQKSSIDGLAGEKGEAEAAAAQHQETGHILHMPRLGNDWR